MKNKIFEHWYPYVGGLLVAAVVFYFRESLCLPDTLKDLFPVVISISAIAVGFLATAKSILLSLDDRPVVRHLKQLGGYSHLVGYLLNAVHWSLFASVVSGGFLLFLNHKDTSWYRNSFAVWAFVTATALLSCYRVLRLFARLLQISANGTRTSSLSDPQ